jgi:hypothetical protein
VAVVLERSLQQQRHQEQLTQEVAVVALVLIILSHLIMESAVAVVQE